MEAILELSRYQGFQLQDQFAYFLLDPDENVSRVSALALVCARPRTPIEVFASALRSENADARINAAWALGELNAPATALLPLLLDRDPKVLQAALMSLARVPGQASAEALLPMLSNADAAVRGAAAVALARHQPEVAAIAIPKQLTLERKSLQAIDLRHAERSPRSFTPAEITQITGSFRCQMKMVEALSMLKSTAATGALEDEAFRPGKDFSQMNSLVAAFDLWDRIGTDARPAAEALGSADVEVADRAEWMLVHAGPAALPEVRKALANENPAVRERAIHIVAWQGDAEAIDTLRNLQKTSPADASTAAWAIDKIESMRPRVRKEGRGNPDLP